jgi:tRNA(fMet)-specific endonuclease VapC
MKPTLVDTDILSLFFRGHPAVVARFAEYAEEHGSIAQARPRPPVRIVLDTNVLMSTVFFGGAPLEILRACLRGTIRAWPRFTGKASQSAVTRGFSNMMRSRAGWQKGQAVPRLTSAPSVPLFGYNMFMSQESLAKTNPYLKRSRSVRKAFIRTVETSTAIEGVHVRLNHITVKSSAAKPVVLHTRAVSAR